MSLNLFLPVPFQMVSLNGPFSSVTGVTLQGVIQDFEVEGGNKKSNQKILLKKGQLLFHSM